MKNTSRLKKTILGIAISIILALFIGYGIETFYPSPRYQDFCEDSFPKPHKVENISQCDYVIESNSEFEQSCYNQDGIVRYDYNEEGCRIAVECDTCNVEYRDASEGYNKVIFIVTLILGLAAVIIGALILKIEPVGSGIMGGGVLTMIYGTLRYWGNLADVGRFIILGLILAILIWLGYKKLNK